MGGGGESIRSSVDRHRFGWLFSTKQEMEKRKGGRKKRKKGGGQIFEFPQMPSPSIAISAPVAS